eukprot:2025640-Rhodomonas_salina.1
MMYSVGAGVGETGCEATDWLSDSALHCFVARSIRRTFSVIVSQGLRASTFSEVISFEVQEVSSLFERNAPTTGSVSLSVSGSGFWLYDLSPGGSTGHTAMEATHWVSSSSLVTQLGAGVGVGHGVTITSGSNARSVSEAVSYNSPFIESIFPQNGPILGKIDISFSGRSYGSASYSPTGKIGETSCFT